MKGLVICIFVFTIGTLGLVIWERYFRVSEESVVLAPSGPPGVSESIVLGVGGFFDYESFGHPGGRFETELEFWHVEKDTIRDSSGFETTLSKLDTFVRDRDENPSDIRLILYHGSDDAEYEDLYFRLSKVVRMGFGEVRLRDADAIPYPPTEEWIPYEDRTYSTPEHTGPSFYVLLTRDGELFTENLGQLKLDELQDWYSDGRLTPEHKIVLQVADRAPGMGIIEAVDAFRSAGGDEVRVDLSVDDGRISIDR